MLYDNYFLLQDVALDLAIAGLLFFIGMSIRDVLRQANVPPLGRKVVWGVLCFGCFGFVMKGVIELYWRMTGLS